MSSTPPTTPGDRTLPLREEHVPASGATVADSDRREALGSLSMRIVLLLFGVAVTIGGIKYGIFDDTGHVAAGFMPFVAGFVMTVAGAWDLIKAMRAFSASPAADAEGVAVVAGTEVESASEDTVEAITGLEIDDEIKAELVGEEHTAGWKAVVSVFGVLLGVTLLASWLGLLITLAIMVFVLLLFVERKVWWAAIIGAALALAFGYFVFEQLLGVPLPKGALGLI